MTSESGAHPRGGRRTVSTGRTLALLAAPLLYLIPVGWLASVVIVAEHVRSTFCAGDCAARLAEATSDPMGTLAMFEAGYEWTGNFLYAPFLTPVSMVTVLIAMFGAWLIARLARWRTVWGRAALMAVPVLLLVAQLTVWWPTLEFVSILIE